HELHKLKRYIDNKVSYKAQGKEGLDTAGERVVKRLRAKIDEALDSASPEYDQANIAYADTKTAIDGIEDILGSKIDTTSKGADRALGIKVRGIQSNAAYGTRLLNALDELDATSAKYGRKFNDDIITMAQLNKAMDEVLGTQAKTSFAGEIGQEVGRAAPISGEAISAIGKVGKKLKGVTPENQLKALEGLLRN
ncbi:MAG: hypothetical protein KAJ19_25730, partial [Gammaproteobacteria bacterium]|nr:hypothetical protein [Gammaproteobacteria bacterium]